MESASKVTTQMRQDLAATSDILVSHGGTTRSTDRMELLFPLCLRSAMMQISRKFEFEYDVASNFGDDNKSLLS